MHCRLMLTMVRGISIAAYPRKRSQGSDDLSYSMRLQTMAQPSLSISLPSLARRRLIQRPATSDNGVLVVVGKLLTGRLKRGLTHDSLQNFTISAVLTMTRQSPDLAAHSQGRSMVCTILGR